MASSQLLSVLLIATCSLTSSFQHQLPAGRSHQGIQQGVRSRHQHLFTGEANNPLSEQSILQSQVDAFPNTDFGSSSSRLSYFTVDEATAAIKQDLRDRASEFSDKLQSGITFDDTGIPDSFKKVQVNLEEAADRLAIAPEAISKAQESLSAYMTETFSAEGLQRTADSFNEFANYYTSSLESRYHISESMESLMNGKAIEDFITSSQDVMQALDMKDNAAFVLLLVAFFWGSDQRNVGLEKGMKIGEEQIKRMEIELDSAKALVRKKNTVESEEVKELRLKMEQLQSRVEELTEVTRKVTEQLEQARNLSMSKAAVDVQQKEVSITTSSSDSQSTKKVGGENISTVDKDISALEVAEAPPKAGNTKAPSKAKKTKSSNATTTEEEQATTAPKIESSEEKKEVESDAEASVTAVSDEPAADDWGRFSHSTLKRKTVKELVAYLNDKGVECTDENGKTLKKDSLVGLVLSN